MTLPIVNNARLYAHQMREHDARNWAEHTHIAADTIEELVRALRNLREVAGAHIQSCPAFEQTDELLANIGSAS